MDKIKFKARNLTMVGKKFNRLKVVSFFGRKDGSLTYKCLCDCGKLYVAKGCLLRNGITKSCGCLRDSCLNKRYKHGLCKKYKVSPIYRMYTHAKHRAKKAGIPFSLSLEDMPDIPKFCPIFPRIKLKINKRHMGNCSPSLDRIVPKLGYIEGNVAVISARANTLKNSLTLNNIENILNYIKRVHK